MPGSSITISAVDLVKAVIFPLPRCSPTDAGVRCAAEHTGVALAHNPIFSTENICVVPVTLYVFVLTYIRVTIAECSARRSELPEQLFARSQGRCGVAMRHGARMFAPWPPDAT